MSSGRVHKNASIILATGFTLSGIFMFDISGIWYAIGSLIGIIYTPDWDVDGGFIGDFYVKKLGPTAEKIWDGFIWLYRKSLKHGSPLSHWPIIGTVGRILYTYLLLFVVPYLIYWIIFHPHVNLIEKLGWFVWLCLDNWRVVLGLMASDFIHFILDIVTTNNTVWGTLQRVFKNKVFRRKARWYNRRITN